jgi:hypothetical protein
MKMSVTALLKVLSMPSIGEKTEIETIILVVCHPKKKRQVQTLSLLGIFMKKYKRHNIGKKRQKGTVT